MASDLSKHRLVPLHTKLSDSEKKELLEKYSSTLRALPKIWRDDPALAKLSAKEGDVIKIERASPTAGKTFYYRGVIDE